MKNYLLLLLMTGLLSFNPAHARQALASSAFRPMPVRSLLGENLKYEISFLWFDRIALGEISLQAGDKPGTYLATLKARTLGVAAFFTRNRVETYTTLMEEGPDGLLRPLRQISDTRRDKGKGVRQRISSYFFDFEQRQVLYVKTTNGKETDRKLLDMQKGQPVYDFLSAFYNLRLKRLGPIRAGKPITLAAFSRKGQKKIVVSRLFEEEQKKMKFPQELLLCKVLLDPETFGSDSSDVYVGFDERLRPLQAVVKNVIGLGDVRGVLTQATNSARLR